LPFAEELKVAIIGDASKLKGALSEAEIGINRFSEKVFSTGKNMTLIGTAITAVSVGLIKMASDAEETATKFSVVFKDVSDQAAKSAKNLSDNFGLSQKAAKQLLSDTGDLLTGFGFTGQAALDLSTKVNELAVDLASFTNYSGGAEGASAALTKALLGERESVKALGISILETDVQAKVLLLTQQGMVFETDRQAKAYATLMIAQEQSKNAIGDFARTSEGFANQMRILKGRVTDTAIALGEHLLPMATKVVGKVIEVVTKLNEWIDAHPKLTGAIVKVGAILGAFALVGGPILMAAAAFMRAKVIIEGMTVALGLMNLKIGATGAITTGTLIPSVAKISTNFGLLGTLTTGPIGIAAVAIGGLYLAWKTNLFGMRDITREAIADIKGNFTNLSDFLQSGGGGGAGAFFDEEIPDTNMDVFEEQTTAAKKAAEDLAEAIKDINDKIYELSHTEIEYSIKKLDEECQAFADLGVSMDLVSQYYEAQSQKIYQMSEAYNDFFDSMKDVEDRLFELTHTQREKEIKDLDEKKEKLIQIAKQAGVSAKEEIAAIKEIMEWYKKELGLLNEIKAGKRYNIYDKTGANIASVGSEQAQHLLEEGYNVMEIPSNTPSQKPGQILTEIPGYATGIKSVPKTGLALVHENEEINPPGKRSYDQPKSYSPSVYVTVQGNGNAEEIKKVVEQALEESRRQYSRGGYQMAY